MSQILHSSDENGAFKISGILGKGLGLQKFGTHVAFAAGTGCLPFVDLVALLLRVNLGQLDKDSIPFLSSGSTFKLVLYISFASRDESLALGLFEGLKLVTEKRGLSNFELNLRITDENKAKRWNEAFIEEKLAAYSNKV